MRCPTCRKPVHDKRHHRHRKDNPEVQRAEAYGRLIAAQERDLLRGFLRESTHESHA